MNEVNIECLHLDVDKNGQSATCARCGDTGQAVARVVESLARECTSKGVRVSCRETKLSAAEIDRSNLILLNGQAIEDILPQAAASQSDCPSYGELVGAQTPCRRIHAGGRSYEAIPADLIRRPACAVAHCCSPSRRHP